MTNPITNPNAWTLVDAPMQSTVAARAAQTDAGRSDTYKNIARQFNVEKNPRYVRGHDNDPKNGEETYCNIYLCDTMLALGVPLPHWMDPATGAPVPMGKGKETSANGVCVWMSQHGFAFDWMECSEAQARKRATAGYPTCVLWLNEGGIGHVAVVLPGTDFTHIAQAGGTNFYDDNLKRGYGGITALRFYTHD